MARELGDKWRLSQILAWQAFTACLAGDPIARPPPARKARARGRRRRPIRVAHVPVLGLAGRAVSSGANWISAVGTVHEKCLRRPTLTADVYHGFCARIGLAHTLVYLGQASEARDARARRPSSGAVGLGPSCELWAYAPLGLAALGRWRSGGGSRGERRGVAN